jgi:hypothetical protein
VDPAILDYESESDDIGAEVASRTEVAVASPVSMETDPTSSSSVQQSSTLDPVYYQCRAARTSSHRDTLVSLNIDGTSGKRVISQAASFGTFEDHPGIQDTFHGTRILKGNTTVNQSISMYFDPSKMVCISCEKEHNIVTRKPLVVLFSDQNFVPSLPANQEACINIVRVENASLHELFDLAFEIFGNITLPEGSIFMYGSASFLGRCGTSLYARSWVEVVARTSSNWRGVRICPLIPLVVSPCPGTLIREIQELSTWFDTVYDNNCECLHESWAALVAALDNCSSGATTLANMDTYKVVLPSSLSSAALDGCTTFCSQSSRPITFGGLSKDNCCELLSSLLNLIFKDFRACSDPESYLVRVNSKLENKHTETGEQTVVLAGASNLKYSARHFSDTNFTFVDISTPGWTANPHNIARLTAEVEHRVKEGAKAFVFDLLGNSSVRYEQFDGTVAAGPPWGSARELSLSPLTRRGDPPPSWPRGG